MAAVVGRPVRHSLSPALHNAAFAATGLDWVYVAFEVGAGGGAAALAAVRALGIDGLSVTMPLKAEMAAAVDRRSEVAEALGAVNTVARQGEALVGHNTDGQGFLDALRHDAGWDPAGRSCLVVGAGGAARAVVLALAGAGAGEVVVINRTPATAELAAALAGPAGRVGVLGDLADADLIVNATPVGMDGGAPASALPVSEHLRGPGQLVVDLVYHPLRTELLAAAAAAGAATADGVGMLVHQAGHAFALWTGEPAPLAAMTEAARRALG